MTRPLKSIPNLIQSKGSVAVPRNCRRCSKPFVAFARKAHFCSDECRFWGKVDKRGPDECWPWIGYRRRDGYGQFSLSDGGRTVASRVSLELHLGRSLETSEHVCHHCDNPPCCNPAHLFLGDPTANRLDCLAKGRSPDSYNKGRSNPNATLTEEGVREIRRLKGSGTYEEIGRKVGASKDAVGKVLTGKTWAHVL